MPNFRCLSEIRGKTEQANLGSAKSILKITDHNLRSVKSIQGNFTHFTGNATQPKDKTVKLVIHCLSSLEALLKYL